MKSWTGRLAQRRAARRQGESQGQIDSWTTCIYLTKGMKGGRANRQVDRLGKEREIDGQADITDMLAETETVCQKQGICATTGTGMPDT